MASAIIGGAIMASRSIREVSETLRVKIVAYFHALISRSDSPQRKMRKTMARIA